MRKTKKIRILRLKELCGGGMYRRALSSREQVHKKIKPIIKKL